MLSKYMLQIVRFVFELIARAVDKCMEQVRLRQTDDALRADTS